MSESKNQIAVKEFAARGTIIDGGLVLPTLWSNAKHKNYRYWILYIGIETTTKEEIAVTGQYVDRAELPPHGVGVYWTRSGVENTERPIISEKTYVKVGKNVNNKNYTTVFTQAILDAKTDFNLKIRRGSQIDKAALTITNTTIENLISQTYRGEHPWRVFAMALHDITKNNNWRHITYPCKIQPKLDGTMFIIVYHPDLPQITISDSAREMVVTMDSYSRGRESYDGQDHILMEIYPVLKNYPGLHLVGELWKRGYGLQDISGFSRRQGESKIKNDPVKLDFNIFDCFYINDQEIIFDERESIIDDIMIDLEIDHKVLYTKQIRSFLVDDKTQLDNKYRSFLDENLEGAVVRNLDSLYIFGVDKEVRSYTTLKYKPRPDDEWPVINFKEGKGKEAGAVIWICAENDSGIRQRLNLAADETLPGLDERKTFNVTPNMDYEKRYEIYKKLSETPALFEKIKGSLITISYSILSKDFLPQQPKAITFKEVMQLDHL